MNRFTKIAILTMSLLLLGNLLIVGAKTAVAQGMGAAIASAESKNGQPACWVAVGNKIYFVEKDDSTILKVKASGAL